MMAEERRLLADGLVPSRSPPVRPLRLRDGVCRLMAVTSTLMH